MNYLDHQSQAKLRQQQLDQEIDNVLASKPSKIQGHILARVGDVLVQIGNALQSRYKTEQPEAQVKYAR